MHKGFRLCCLGFRVFGFRLLQKLHTLRSADGTVQLWRQADLKEGSPEPAHVSDQGQGVAGPYLSSVGSLDRCD